MHSCIIIYNLKGQNSNQTIKKKEIWNTVIKLVLLNVMIVLFSFQKIVETRLIERLH